MKNIILITFLHFIAITIMAQSAPIDWCAEENRLADSIISKGELDLPVSALRKRNIALSYTAENILRLEYGISERTLAGCIRKGAECYDETMFNVAEAKYGEGFYTRQKQIGDSLDKAGLGYISPKCVVNIDSLEKAIYDKFHLKNTVLYIVVYKVTEEGFASDIQVYNSKDFGPQVDVKEDKALQKKIARYWEGKKYWAPAYLRGQALDGQEVIMLIHQEEFK